MPGGAGVQGGAEGTGGAWGAGGAGGYWGCQVTGVPVYRGCRGYWGCHGLGVGVQHCTFLINIYEVLRLCHATFLV